MTEVSISPKAESLLRDPRRESQIPRTTPLFANKNTDKFEGISPTQPLNIRQQALPRDRSEKSLITVYTHQSESSLNTFETAMDYEDESRLTNTTEAQESESSSDKTFHDTSEGLGIETLAVSSNASASSLNHRPKFVSPDYNDDPTPKIDRYTFEHPQIQLVSPEDNYKDDEFDFFTKSTKEFSLTAQNEDQDDTTPKLLAPERFQGHNKTLSAISHNVTPNLDNDNDFSPENPQHGHSGLGNDLEHFTGEEMVATIESPDAVRVHGTTNQEPVREPKQKTEQPLHQRTSSNFQGDETTYSQELNDISEAKRDRHQTADLLGASPNVSTAIDSKEKLDTSKEDEELTSLFLTALHDFDAGTLELSSDSALCLSFDTNDVVFVHAVDSSGWGEVTLIKTLKRGWVPINFFTELINTEVEPKSSQSKAALSSLLISGAKFINNPIDNPDNGEAGFSIGMINDIRDGVRELLEKCDCLSRSTDIVKKKPIIRRIRKSLLADWYSLMIKADTYKHSKSVLHVETLQLMVIQVIKKGIAFLEIWALEVESIKKEVESIKKEVVQQKKEEDKVPQTKIADRAVRKNKNTIPYLKQTPFAKERLNEIHNILFSYIGLLIGRLDMVEHNPSGCQVLESITHQVILLLREILSISKSCVLILNDRNNKVQAKQDDTLDTLLSLVSELVSGVKNFITKTIEEDYSGFSISVKEGLYYYTPEGDELIGIVSRMTRAISQAVESCYDNLLLIGDFRLSDEKSYPDFRLVQITPEQFIKTCSVGLINTMKNKEHDLKNLKNLKRINIKRQSRFSMIRSGQGPNTELTESGGNLLQEFLPDSKSFTRDSVFQPYLTDSDAQYQLTHDVKSEIVRDGENRLIGASFRALVFLLTDELNKPDPFLISTFFLTFKSYSNGAELIEELLSRFNLTNKFDQNDDYDETGQYSSYESRLKNRRRLICKMFQIWLQSYWDYENDYNLLPTLINFFNEGVSQFLPIEAKRLIELCTKLTVLTPGKIRDNETWKKLAISEFPSTTSLLNNNTGVLNNSGIQLVKRQYITAKHSSMLSHSSSVYSISSLNKELDDDDYIFEEYELTKLNSTSRNSLLLPLPGINHNHNSLLGKSQVQEIENLVLIYRRHLGSTFWVHDDYVRYYPVELTKLLKKWFETSKVPFSKNIKIDYNLVELNSFELAKQLTIIESKIFLAIRPEELLNNNYSEKKAKLNLSPNVAHSLLFTNLLSEYVLESILDPSLAQKGRAQRIKSWLNVSLSCYYLKNFNSLAAIIISLQSHMLSRLNELWIILPEKYQNLFEDLKKIIHPSNNYKGYRYKISKLIDEGESKSLTPVVPYVNLFLQDLTFIQEGNKDFRNSNSFLRSRIINFDKFLRVSKIVANLEFLQVGYDSAMTKKNKRNSIFSFNSSTSFGDGLSPILPLQEYILLEFWRVHQLKLGDTDRYWSLSKQLKN